MGYIYFTRIIVYFLSVTVPFSYQWTVDLCREMAVFTFYIVTGYMFRPASNNPYMRVAVDENGDGVDDDEDDGGEMILMDQMFVSNLPIYSVIVMLYNLQFHQRCNAGLQRQQGCLESYQKNGRFVCF